jgi:hypothetical protein
MQTESAEVPRGGVCGIERLQRPFIPEESKNPTRLLARILRLFVVCDAGVILVDMPRATVSEILILG